MKRVHLICILILMVMNLSSCFAINLIEFREQLQEVGVDDNGPVDLPPQDSVYDFIIVGSSPAGCVLANRLSENPNWTVYLLEAGGKPSFLHDMPVMNGFMQRTKSNWNFKTTSQANACKGMYNGECALPRGKVLGGTTQLNFMLYSRGNSYDFNRISEEGNDGWSYDELLPYFLRSEMSSLKGYENSPYHNKSGYVSVEDIKYRTDMSHLFVEGAQQAGHPYNDYNGESQLGVSYVQANTLNGRRHTALKAYLKNLQDERPNLHVLTFARATKILIDPKTKTAYGVNFLHRGLNYTIRARKEVIISAGTFNSPQLLMLSGVGPKENLESVGIPQLHNLSVGENLQDHMSIVGTIFLVNSTGETLFLDRITPIDLAKFNAGDPSTIVSSTTGLESLILMKANNSDKPTNVPDIELSMFKTSLAGDYGFGMRQAANIRESVYNKLLKPLEKSEHYGFIISHLYPKSRGSVRLADSNPLSPPLIDPNYLNDPEDLEYLLAGIRETVRISKTPALQKINATLYQVPASSDCESYEFDSDNFWRCWIKLLNYPTTNQVGTCKMGPVSDSTAVVNSELKVHGIKGLRIADTSVLPHTTSGHVSAIAYVVGEKTSDMIKKEWTK